MLALIEQKCVLDLKGVLMVGIHIYFSPDSVFCTYYAEKAAEEMCLHQWELRIEGFLSQVPPLDCESRVNLIK